MERKSKEFIKCNSMKKVLLRSVLLLVVLLTAGQGSAQGLGGLLKQVGTSVAGSQSDDSSSQQNVVASLLGSLIGTDKISTKALVGKWDYSSPAVAFESDNFLKQAGSAIVSQTVEKKMQTHLTKLGFTPGKVKYTFNEDGTYAMTLKNRTFTGTYKLDGATITFTPKGLISKSVTANMKVVGNQMQLTFKADKLLDFLGTVGAAAGSTVLNSVGTLAGSYQGMQLGFRFSK